MTRLTIWDPSIGERPANLALTNNFSATTDPTVSNDGTQGYTPGSQWINTVDGKVFVMLSNATGAAVWQSDSQAAGETQQGAPAAVNATATLTAANIKAGIITSSTAAAVAATMPLATDMDAGFPAFGAGDAFDFSVIVTGGTNDLTMTTNTGWTLTGTGNMVVTHATSGRFRARKTGTGAWTLYRLS